MMMTNYILSEYLNVIILCKMPKQNIFTKYDNLFLIYLKILFCEIRNS